MKPTSFNTTPQRHYCLIVVSLACDDAIEAGIIAKDNVTPLLFFFIKAWKNVQIHRWLTNRNTSMLRESRLIGLISFLYEKGSVFEYDCKRSTIANLLLETGDLNTIYPNDTFFHLYFFKSRKHSDGRQGTSSFCASITTADRIFAAIGWSTPTADRVLDASGWNTLTADGIPDAMGWSTPTGDRVLATTAEIRSRPTENFRNLRKHRDGRQGTRCDWMEYAHGRRNTRYYRMEYANGRQSTCHNGGNTLSADLILPRFFRTRIFSLTRIIM